MKHRDEAGKYYNTRNRPVYCGIIGTILMVIGIIVLGILFTIGFAAALAQHHN